MARPHGLHGLAFSAIGRAPKRPVAKFADSVARIPELRGDAAVAGILQHANFFSTFDFPADFSGKLKLVAAVVDGPGAICLHKDSVVSVGDEVVVVPGAREQADIGHANDREAIPAFGAHGSGGAIEPDQMSGLAVGKIAAELAVCDDVRALRCTVESGGFFGDDWRVSDQIERVHEFIALKGMLAAKTIGIGTLLDFFALK